MHIPTLLSTAAAILPVASAAAINKTEPHLETDAWSSRAWVNQRAYEKNRTSTSWATCNEKNTVVRKEW